MRNEITISTSGEVTVRSVIVLFDQGMTLAGERFEFLPVQNSHEATGVFDYAFSLEHAGCDSDAWPVCTQHRGEEIVCDRDNS